MPALLEDLDGFLGAGVIVEYTQGVTNEQILEPTDSEKIDAAIETSLRFFLANR